MTTVPHAGLTTDQYPPFRFDMVGHGTGGTFVVPPPTAPAGSAAPVSAAPTRLAGGDDGAPAAGQERLAASCAASSAPARRTGSKVPRRSDLGPSRMTSDCP
jgi:hypothetical protein